MKKKKIGRKGYKILAIIWTLAAAAMAVATVRTLQAGMLNMGRLILTAVSVLAASSFWRSYKRTPEGDETK